MCEKKNAVSVKSNKSKHSKRMYAYRESEFLHIHPSPCCQWDMREAVMRYPTHPSQGGASRGCVAILKPPTQVINNKPFPDTNLLGFKRW